MSVQHLASLALLVADYDEAKAWYVDRLGFAVLEDTDLGEGKRWVLIAPPGAGGAALLLARAADDRQRARVGDQTGGRVFLFLNTDDIWGDHERYTARGVVFEGPPRREPYGTVAVFQDLHGNRWDLIQPAARAFAFGPGLE
jgi:catechol 2,3-dioxygenase-like lactoylglutathione lyase family enzyme